MLKPKVGDMVRLKPMPVFALDQSDSTFMLRDKRFSAWVHLGDIEEIVSRPLAVGDKVAYWTTPDYYYEIIGIHGDEAWLRSVNVKMGRIQTSTAKCADLKRVEDA